MDYETRQHIIKRLNERRIILEIKIAKFERIITHLENYHEIPKGLREQLLSTAKSTYQREHQRYERESIEQ